MRARRGRGLLAIAIEREDWELASLCLIAGFLEALQGLPPDAAESLLEVMSTDQEPRPHRSRDRRRGRKR